MGRKQVKTYTEKCSCSTLETRTWKLNPADIPMQKVSPKDLQNNVVWWEGPTFLSKHKTEWPEQKEIMEIQSCEDV